ncbi:hypothetical protein PHLCEN_2v8010 [Hermanssonia centrifuga]|uniref:Uncharacterized protein n=1 Tax=Hermanssonia centrifuga TaxID=98765 RepID=A0A2R6NV28_9APHY|nr:hypothetical protein PHLCEN_2v8010 [Hermanssonia centrifuga]
MSDSDNTASSSTPFQPIALQIAKAQRQYQQLLDRVTPFVLYRWLGTAGVLAIFMLRIVLSQGWYIDAHAIYLLNLLLAFLQPKFDPSLQEDLMADEIEEGGEEMGSLPSQRDDEFRPFTHDQVQVCAVRFGTEGTIWRKPLVVTGQSTIYIPGH